MTFPAYHIWPYNCVDAMLHLMAERSVHCVVTSPPYFGLRDYETGQWEGGDPACRHEHEWVNYPGATGTAVRNIAANKAKSIRRRGAVCPCGARFDDQQLGHEPSPDEYVANIVQVARAVWRVLRDDGTFWLNLGDTYANDPKGPNGADKSALTAGGAYQAVATASRPALKYREWGIRRKSLLGIPWRVALALQADGWILRQDIIWHKRNPMPESARDRFTKAHEYLFLLVKQPRYYFDGEAVKEPAEYGSRGSRFDSGKTAMYGARGRNLRLRTSVPQGGFGGKGPIPGTGQSSFRAITDTRNKRDVWTLSSRPYKGAHFATFPPDLVEPCVLAGSPPSCCAFCGAPRAAKVKRTPAVIARSRRAEAMGEFGRYQSSGQQLAPARSEVLGYEPTCKCGGPDVPAVVLDPFGGSGTTAVVALRHGRFPVLCEINPGYVEIAHARIAGGK